MKEVSVMYNTNQKSCRCAKTHGVDPKVETPAYFFFKRKCNEMQRDNMRAGLEKVPWVSVREAARVRQRTSDEQWQWLNKLEDGAVEEEEK